MLVAERALQARLAVAIATAGRRAAEAQRHGESIEAATRTLPNDLARALVPALVDTARTFGGRVIRSPKSAHAFVLERKAFYDLDRGIADHFEGHTARRVVAISDAVREQIRAVIYDGLVEDLGIDALARRIVEATSGDIGMARALRIARTEIHNAAMYGQQAAAEASPLAFEKVWLATEDARTRQSHADANDQRRPLDEAFVLEGEKGPVRLMYPGDRNGPPGETINCRCTVAYEPLPFLKPLPEDAGPPAQTFEPDRPLPEPLPDDLSDLTRDGRTIGRTEPYPSEQRPYRERLEALDARIADIRAGDDPEQRQILELLGYVIAAVENVPRAVSVDNLQTMLRNVFRGEPVALPPDVWARLMGPWRTGKRLLAEIRRLRDGGLSDAMVAIVGADREQVRQQLAGVVMGDGAVDAAGPLSFLPGPLDAVPPPLPIVIEAPDEPTEIDQPEPDPVPTPQPDRRLEAWARDVILGALIELERPDPDSADDIAARLAGRVFEELLTSPPGTTTHAALTAIRERLDDTGWRRSQLRQYLERQLDSDLTEEAL